MRLARGACIKGLAVGLGLFSPAAATSQFKDRVLARDPALFPTYDYVIVGGGVSGLTVANRLSEDAGLSILVIEAGEFDHNEDSILIPGLAGGVIGTKYDWNLTYVSNPDAGDRSVSIPQGKVVGGSSLLNRMVFDRGSAADYDRWSALGNEGWGWRGLFPFFKKSETFTPPNEDIQNEWNVTYDLCVHGETGPIQSSWAPWIWPATRYFIDAITSFGVRIPRDAASGDAVGGYWCPHSQDPVTVTRSDARRAYWDPASHRPGLHLVTGQRVTRLITEKTAQGPRITGVEVAASSGGARKIVNVRKEAILAAGSLHTPQILQLSGIGDTALLGQRNISTVANIPGVGHNLQDHVYVPVVFQFDFPLTAANLTENATFAAESLALYNSEKTGPYADATGNFLAFLPTGNFTTAADAQSIHSAAQAQDPTTYLDTDTPTTVQAGYALQHELLVEGINRIDEAQLEIIWSDGTFVLGLQHPFSRGSVRLASTNPFDAPLADAAFLRNPVDVQILIAAVKYARKLAASPVLAAFNPVELVPGPDVTADADLEAYIRGAAESLYHPSGSASVGKEQLGGVVDEEFRVHGVKGLRVVDASVLPMLPATHIQSSVYAVAEKAAEAIRRS
ncbi:GMC family oxidoreductase [Aspergillus undulatus]|uniref:GMC family oxidoreductase n=1 Tax=Aspergillus undulatus TaxID=1810928 RepID=UPI003CCD2F79